MAGPFDFLDDLSPLLNLGGGIWSYFDDKDAADELRAASTSSVIDPFGASNRQRYQGLLNQTYGDPSRVSDLPGYTFAKEQGEKAINRGAAKRGGFYSGNVLHELARYNQGLAGQFYGDEMDRLMLLSGAGFAPQAPSSAQLTTAGVGLDRNAPGHLTAGLGLSGGGGVGETLKQAGSLASTANSAYTGVQKIVDLFSGGSSATNLGSTLGTGIGAVGSAASGALNANTIAASAPTSFSSFAPSIESSLGTGIGAVGGATGASAAASGGHAAGSLSGLVGPSAGYASNAATLAGGAASALSGVGGHAAGSLAGLIGPSAGYASNAATLAAGTSGASASTAAGGLFAGGGLGALAGIGIVAPTVLHVANEIFGGPNSIEQRASANDKIFQQYSKSAGVAIHELQTGGYGHRGEINGRPVQYHPIGNDKFPQFELLDRPGYVLQINKKTLQLEEVKASRSYAYRAAAIARNSAAKQEENKAMAIKQNKASLAHNSNQDEVTLPTTDAGWANYFEDPTSSDWGGGR